MSELKPCSCGGEAKFQVFGNVCNVVCEKCHIGTRYELIDDIDIVVKTWNALQRDPYEAVSCEHVITPDGLRELLAEWDMHPGRAATNEEMLTLFGRDVCEMDLLSTGNEADYEHQEHIMHCKHCHHKFGYVQYDEDGGTWMDERPRYCPNCGKPVSA